MSKILILGSNGMVGSMMSSYLSIYHNVIKLGRPDFDVLTTSEYDFSNYDYVINCIGLIKQKSSDTDLLFKINAEFPHKLAKSCKKLFHISSDCVFSGNLDAKYSYTTNDAPDATDDYGKSKADGEPINNSMVLRTSVIGPAKDNYGLFEWFRNSPEDLVKGYDNHWWSGVSTLELAKIIHNTISNDNYQPGLFQIAGSKVSKYELLVLIKNIFGIQKDIQKCSDKISVNRSLVGDILAQDIDTQLQELCRFEQVKDS